MNFKFKHFLSLNLIQPLYNVVLPPSLTYFTGIRSRLTAVIGFAIVEYCIPDYRLCKTDGSGFMVIRVCSFPSILLWVYMIQILSL